MHSLNRFYTMSGLHHKIPIGNDEAVLFIIATTRNENSFHFHFSVVSSGSGILSFDVFQIDSMDSERVARIA